MCASGVTAFVPVWRPRPDVECWRGVGQRDANASQRKPMPTTIGRLKRRADFLRIARAGNKCAVRGLVLQSAPTPSGDLAPECDLRIGFTVTKRVGNAVVRNRARRRLRAVARSVFPSRATPGFDYVVIARQSTPIRAFSDLVGDMEKALMRLNADRSDLSSRPNQRAETTRK